MAGGAFDMSGFQTEQVPSAVPDIKEGTSSEKSFDLSGFQPEEAEKPSFIKRAANAVSFMKQALGGAEKSLDQKINDLGTMEVPTGHGPEKETVFNIWGDPKAKDSLNRMGALNTAVNLATLPVAGEYIGGEGALTAGGAAARATALLGGTLASNKIGAAAANLLEREFPSQSLHARFLKWLAEQGVSGAAFAPFLAVPSVLARIRLGAALHDPGWTPEAPETLPAEGVNAEGAAPAEKPAESVSEPSRGTSEGFQLTPKPTEEPTLLPKEPEPVVLDKPIEEEPISEAEQKPTESSPSKVNTPEPEALVKETPAEQREQADREAAIGQLSNDLSRYPGGNEVLVPTDEIYVDPPRFQYKLNTNKEGAGRALTGSRKFDPNLMDGPLLLWRDPEDGKLYAVDGHNRRSMAKASGVSSLPAKIADGGNSDPDAFAHNMTVEDVRALGAIRNIAGEKGTAIDTAKFFRDQKASPEDLAAIGVDMDSKMVRDGLALKKLDENLFRFVTTGDLTQNQGVILGEELGDNPSGQRDAFKWLKEREASGKEITDAVLREVAQDINNAGEVTEAGGQGGLPGMEDYVKRSLFEERGEIMAAIKKKLASEKNAFANAAKNKAKLEGVGNILTDENANIAALANDRLGVLRQKKTGPINELLNAAARELADNPKAKNKIISDVYQKMLGAADETLANRPSSPAEEPSPQQGMFGAEPEKPKAKAPLEPGTVLGASIPGGPQLAAVIEPEVRYWAEKFSQGGKGWLDAVRAQFAPQTRGPLAKRAGQIIVEARGEQAARIVPDEVVLAPLRAELEKIPEAEWRRRYQEFYDAYEKNQVPANLPAKLRPLIPRIKAATDERWKIINALRQNRGRRPMAYLDNYLAHLYADDPAKVRETLNQMGRTSGKQLSQGTPFLNERKYLAITDAMKAGLTPRYKNPIDMVIAGLRQQDAYIAAETMFRNLYDAGLIRFIPEGKFEEGWEKIPDRFFDVKQYSDEAGGMIQRGSYQAPKEVVKVLSNHLSPSLAADDANFGGRALKMVGPGSGVARFNAFRVGFSSFHFLNENNAAMAQLQGTGVARALAGLASLDGGEMANGVKLFAKGNDPTEIYRVFADGDKIMRALIEPGTQGAEYDKAVEAAIQGGMRFKAEQVGTLAETLRRAFGDVLHPLARDMAEAREKPPITRAVSAIAKEPARWADLSSTALMNYYIPRVKLGAFYRLAAQEMDRYTARAGGQLPFAMQRQILQDVAAHVDSVFGQMVEDNLFMSRTMKDLLHLGIAYPGWNIGSLRLAWKAAGGLGRIATFRAMDTQQRLALQFGLGLVTSQAIQNAMLMRMLAGVWPRTIQDLFQPQDGGKDAYGNPSRIAGPSYMRTYISIASHPVSWAQNVANPIWGAIDDVVNNRERFTGRQLWDPEAPLAEQAAQFGEYLFRFALPFSFTNYERIGQESHGARKALGVLGYSPVPAQYLRTEAENYVVSKAGEKAPRVGLNERQYAAKQAGIALEDAIREKKPLDESHRKALMSLEPGLREKVEESAAKAAQLPRIVNLMRRMPLHQVMDTYEIAKRNGDIRNMKYAQVIVKNKAQGMSPQKWDAELEALDPATRERYQNMLVEILTGKKPEAAPAASEPLS